ncbi:MAG: Tetratricopeptide TPR_2 repeat protein [Candidatus Woesebacteria bacterium GW2011_GWA1_33_30]|uniref:Tetratricopeptide TPR_2 repeat protein n=1 Tax=Candidatus Woesebacteria bacterium GW2011_GWA2_33_28 TaxID=1618561 RepID=A0A0F9ZUU1_9BACT|nr:MAG: Tetratricopeptide TPR_2 repeat protein [Candidatus Woesebacteria bacterium GW2011_GWA2_33_28]KKP48837.1 MAG: Tetratricopeptide TPR_2 repeat protein [Candidatus Woesebacteria bacterium GW2011_GWA1_33_30]KKP50110.1 MAG: Tetratricopeptide TPR_2 repeat protein [Microgenomates group bacterium GW2011_GWC1_33_32]KKP51881.1 MAG: Tetratricopeptide TPR_2 repeat protein [Candidatus Woesebacteria bacterium GW2011_GWB1_33_38]KKP56811.1 MAG: Tetratricopeptide TPR_2 repeat protein [Microgenomates grou
MDDTLTQKAINLALKCDWSEAIKTNLKILKINPSDIDTLNRLSRSYYENGDLTKAKKTSLNVLKIDSTNNIALKAVKKYKQSKVKKINHTKNIDTSIFIEEPGKTKLINLINVGSSSTCACLNSGDEVILTTHTHKVSLIDCEGRYIGRLPDDLSAKLRNLIKGGNEYKAYVKSVEGKDVKVLIKEARRGEEFKNVQSFPRESLESITETFSDSDL